mmetsp:Transcript_42957/g.132746  ORF Transcript_42957/g.132746 Transcript_42957/m.132746 type:complete len:871 (-) Transcript_42957:1665-4277(-)
MVTHVERKTQKKSSRTNSTRHLVDAHFLLTLVWVELVHHVDLVILVDEPTVQPNKPDVHELNGEEVEGGGSDHRHPEVVELVAAPVVGEPPGEHSADENVDGSHHVRGEAHVAQMASDDDAGVLVGAAVVGVEGVRRAGHVRGAQRGAEVSLFDVAEAGVQVREGLSTAVERPERHVAVLPRFRLPEGVGRVKVGGGHLGVGRHGGLILDVVVLQHRAEVDVLVEEVRLHVKPAVGALLLHRARRRCLEGELDVVGVDGVVGVVDVVVADDEDVVVEVHGLVPVHAAAVVVGVQVGHGVGEVAERRVELHLARAAGGGRVHAQRVVDEKVGVVEAARRGEDVVRVLLAEGVEGVVHGGRKQVVAEVLLLHLDRLEHLLLIMHAEPVEACAEDRADGCLHERSGDADDNVEVNVAHVLVVGRGVEDGHDAVHRHDAAHEERDVHVGAAVVARPEEAHEHVVLDQRVPHGDVDDDEGDLRAVAAAVHVPQRAHDEREEEGGERVHKEVDDALRLVEDAGNEHVRLRRRRVRDVLAVDNDGVHRAHRVAVRRRRGVERRDGHGDVHIVGVVRRYDGLRAGGDHVGGSVGAQVHLGVRAADEVLGNGHVAAFHALTPVDGNVGVLDEEGHDGVHEARAVAEAQVDAEEEALEGLSLRHVDARQAHLDRLRVVPALQHVGHREAQASDDGAATQRIDVHARGEVARARVGRRRVGADVELALRGPRDVGQILDDDGLLERQARHQRRAAEVRAMVRHVHEDGARGTGLEELDRAAEVVVHHEVQARVVRRRLHARGDREVRRVPVAGAGAAEGVLQLGEVRLDQHRLDEHGVLRRRRKQDRGAERLVERHVGARAHERGSRLVAGRHRHRGRRRG